MTAATPKQAFIVWLDPAVLAGLFRGAQWPGTLALPRVLSAGLERPDRTWPAGTRVEIPADAHTDYFGWSADRQQFGLRLSHETFPWTGEGQAYRGLVDPILEPR